MKLFSLVILLCISIRLHAQKDSFDLIRYSPPENWVKGTEEALISYTRTGNNGKWWCRINIVKSTISKGNIDQDFEDEWQQLMVKNYSLYGERMLKERKAPDGWKIKTGTSKFRFNQKEADAILTTASGFNRCISIVVVTNTLDYLSDAEKMLASVVLVEPKRMSENTVNASMQNQVVGTQKIIGVWGVGKTVASLQNMQMNEGSMVTQYTFNADNTYSFYIKTFRYQSDRLLLTKETGTYTTNGNKLTVLPKKSVVESWTRKDGTDKWGRLVSSTNNTLEKVAYSFSIENFGTGWVLILKAPAITKRDGVFNNSNKDAWFYPAKSAIELISLPSQ